MVLVMVLVLVLVIALVMVLVMVPIMVHVIVVYCEIMKYFPSSDFSLRHHGEIF